MGLLRFIAARIFKDPDSSLTLMKRLVAENAREHVAGYALSFALMAVVAATTAASAWIMKDVINEIFIEKRGEMIYIIAGAVIVIYVLKGAATYGQNIILSRIGNGIVAANQRRLYAHILKQGMSFYDSYSLGDLATRMSHNAQSAREVINLLVVSLGRDLFSLIGLLVVIVSQNPQLSLFALVVAVPSVFGVASLIKKIRKIAQAEFLSLARIVSIMQETVLGARIVKAFGAEGDMQQTMNGAIKSVEQRANRIAALQARTSPLMETLGGIAVALVILWGGYSVVYLDADPGAFFAFITALLMAYEPAKRLARLHVQLEAGMIGVKIMYNLLDTDLCLSDKPDATALAVANGEVRFENVHFEYDADKPALHGLSFVAEPGKTTALVGPSGAGKSTVLALIERYYDVDDGRVLVDGQDVRDVTLASLRAEIALVTQDTFLFQGTVRENILRGRPDATDEEVVEAARNANAHEFIEVLPGGYDSHIGEDGNKLSGGQRQRIAIARAMLRDAPILLLDEATSALDAESEFKIQAALQRLMVGRTTIVIAHRLSTVREADKIVVMVNGAAVEEGGHGELVGRGGLYSRLHDLQFAA